MEVPGVLHRKRVSMRQRSLTNRLIVGERAVLQQVRTAGGLRLPISLQGQMARLVATALAMILRVSTPQLTASPHKALVTAVHLAAVVAAAVLVVTEMVSGRMESTSPDRPTLVLSAISLESPTIQPSSRLALTSRSTTTSQLKLLAKMFPNPSPNLPTRLSTTISSRTSNFLDTKFPRLYKSTLSLSSWAVAI